jgi:hypothetical protein
MQTLFCCADLDQAGEMDFERRFANCPAPTIGDMTWMDPDRQEPEWQVITTHLFKSVNQSVCLAEVAKGEVIESSLPDAIHLYLLDDQFYTYAVVGGMDMPPALGDFVEYEPGSSRALPVDKEVTHYETLTGDASCRVYVAHLQPVKVLVAA